MNSVNRLLVNICSNNVSNSKDFYTKLFNFEVEFESDWFVQLISKETGLELGIIERSHQIVPKDYRNTPQGFYLTFVVDDADAVFEFAKESKLEIIEKPHDTFYGQRRLLLKDPDGTLLDVSSLISNS